MSRRADVVLRNGRVLHASTAHERDAHATTAAPLQSVAIIGERIVAVGPEEEVEGLVGPGTRTIDLGGRLVTPGFHDAHVHFAGGCLGLRRVYLKDAADEAEFGRRLREFDAKLPEGAWMTGGRWDHDLTFGGTFPTAKTLDRYVPDRPVFLRRYDGHVGLANTRALQVAGVTRETPGPSGGEVVRDESGEPTGLLHESAMDLVWRHIPDPSADEIAAALPDGLALAARMGITSAHDMLGDGGPCLEAYRSVEARGDLTLRLNLYWPIGDRQAAEAMLAEAHAELIRLRGLKAFVDGSLGAGTAWFHEPYANDPSTSGIACCDMGWLTAEMVAADAAGLQLAVHAIGDRAVSELLSAWEAVAEANGPRDRRFRMEHAQHIRAADIERFRRLGAVASMQPYHATDDSRFCEKRIGAERCGEAYAFRSLSEAGVALAFGSDWPVAPLDVIAGIDSAANRRPAGEADPWHPEQRLPVAEALAACTSGAAYAAFAEGELGTLEPGKLADLVVLSRDVTGPAEAEAIGETEVLLTMMGGRVVHEAGVL